MTYEQARRELLMLRGLSADGSGRQPNRGFTDRRNATAGGNVRTKIGRPDFYESGPQGIAPNEQEIRDFWIANGGGGKKRSRGNATAAAVSEEAAMAARAAANKKAPVSAYEQLLLESADDLKSQTQKANDANQKRYDEEHGLATGVLNSGMAEINNWGNVQYQQNAEAAQQNLDKINTDLTDYGLANSTNRIAAKLNSDKNLALEQQDLSERKSDRALQANRVLTGDLRDVVRSRVDNAPDPNQLMAIYAKLGEAQAMEKARANDQSRVAAAATGGKSRRRSLAERIAAMRTPDQKRTSNAYGQFMGAQMQANFGGGLAGAMGAVNNSYGMGLNNYTPAWTSNAFPHLPGESRDDAYYRRTR